jgi:trans-aconitate methyltransferase
MPNDRQFQAKTRIVATRDVKGYRATIVDIVRADDVVLEIGCEWGTTTPLLTQHAASVLATDVSSECIDRARANHPDLSFDVLDAFDLRAIVDLGRAFTVIYIDVSGISGFRSTLDVLALLNSYSSLLAPRVIVVKSGSLVNLARRLEARG